MSFLWLKDVFEDNAVSRFHLTFMATEPVMHAIEGIEAYEQYNQCDECRWVPMSAGDSRASHVCNASNVGPEPHQRDLGDASDPRDPCKVMAMDWCRNGDGTQNCLIVSRKSNFYAIPLKEWPSLKENKNMLNWINRFSGDSNFDLALDTASDIAIDLINPKSASVDWVVHVTDSVSRGGPDLIYSCRSTYRFLNSENKLA